MSKQIISPKIQNIREFFDSKLFFIPEYQRVYSWKSEQRKDLFDDVQLVLDTFSKNPGEAYHFMSTLVILKTDPEPWTHKATEYYQYDIVDGQQRLTTLVILLKALEKAYPTQIQEMLVKEGTTTKVLLQTNHGTSQIFTDYLFKGTLPDPASLSVLEKDLCDAFFECEAWLQKPEISSRFEQLHTVLTNRVRFLIYEIEEEKYAYTIFEVINSRGLPVSWLDILKSLLMSYEYTNPRSNRQQKEEIKQAWKSIYEHMGQTEADVGSEAFRMIATLWYDPTIQAFKDEFKIESGKLLGEEKAVNIFRHFLKTSTDGSIAVRISTEIQRASESLSKLWRELRLRSVVELSQARLLALSIDLSSFQPLQKSRLLKQWENSTFRLFGMLQLDSRKKVNDYVLLARDIYKNSFSDLEQSFQSFLQKIRLLAKDEASIEEALEKMKEIKNWYDSPSMKTDLVYFLRRYEEFLEVKSLARIRRTSEQLQAAWYAEPSKSIEHVLPRSTGSKHLINRLGNLILLTAPGNSSLSNKPIEQKKEAYLDSKLYHVREIVTFATCPDGTLAWSEDQIFAREEALFAFAKEEWGDLLETPPYPPS